MGQCISGLRSFYIERGSVMLKRIVSKIPGVGELESLEKRDEIVRLTLKILQKKDSFKESIIDGMLFVAVDNCYIVVRPGTKDIGTVSKKSKESINWGVPAKLYDAVINVLKNMAGEI